jgi:polyisoprenoid-binding protein YceI
MFKKVSLIAIMLTFSTGYAATVDSSKSEFAWTGKKVTGQHQGKLPLKSSEVKMNADQIASGEFIVDLTQLTVEDLTGEYKDKFLTHIKSADFFDVEKWPTAKLVVTKISGNQAEGKLTIKDKTNPVKFNFDKKENVYTGKLVFDRTKYGMIYGSGNFFKNLGDKTIYNDVTLDFKVTIVPDKK